MAKMMRKMSMKKMSSMKKRSSMKKMSMKKMSSKKMGKRKMNAFFTLMLAAKKKSAPSFHYNGKTYVAKKLKTGMTVYKKK